MSQLVGANPDDLDALAQKVQSAVALVESIRDQIGNGVQHAPWEGRNADRFREAWSLRHRPAMRSSSVFLSEMAAELRRHAGEQRDASRDTGTGPLPRSPFESCRETPETVADATRQRMEERRDELRTKRPFGADPGLMGLLRHNDADRRTRSEEEELARLEALLDGDRQFLAYSAENGDHRITEVYGDLSTAKKVIIHIPGMKTNLDHYVGSNGHGDAAALYGQVKGSGDVAVISFADYDIPGNFANAASGHGADVGAERLRALVSMLRAQGYDADDISVVAHSYGTVVAGHAMQQGLDVGRVVALGSPGMGADTRAGLGSPNVELYAGSAWTDPIDDGSKLNQGLRGVRKLAAWSPTLGPTSIGAALVDAAISARHGTSPAHMDGVQVIGTGDAQLHSSYFKGESLRSVVAAAIGG